MTQDEMLLIAVERLHAQGHLLHSQMLHLAEGDVSVMDAVRNRLIEEGLATDQYGVVKLVPGRATVAPKADNPANRIPSSRATVANMSALVESHASLPVSGDDPTKSIGSGPNFDHDSPEPRLKSLWSIAAVDRQQCTVASTSQPPAQVSIAGITAANDPRPAANPPVLPGAASPRQPPSPSGFSGTALRYLLWNAGREEGPFPREELEHRLAEGRLKPTDFVRIESDDEWIPASKALARKGPSSKGNTDSKPASGTRTPTEEIAMATSLAIAISAAARQAARSHSTTARRQSSEMTGSLHSGWNWLQQCGGKMPLRYGALLLIIVFGLWAFWNWPPATQSISAEFHQCAMQLDAIAKLKGTSSPEWKQFVDKKLPRIKQLVESLESRANAEHPAYLELHWVGEAGLLPMLRDGLPDEARQKFNVHWHNYLQIIEGATPTDLDVPGSAAHVGPSNSNAANSEILTDSSSSSNRTSSEIPPGVPATEPYAPSGTPSANQAVPPRRTPSSQTAH